jgi:hypothetical protein
MTDGQLSRAPAQAPSASALSEAAVHAAQEVIVALDGPLPPWIDQWLAARRATGRPVVVLCGPGVDAEYLRTLLQRGHTVYDAVLEGVSAGEALLFLDRQQGYRLPSGRPLDQPFATACRLMWQRIGAYLHVGGHVSAVYPTQRAFQLGERERAWFIVPGGRPLPRVAEAVGVVARVFWGGGSGLAVVYEAVAWWPAPCGPAPAEACDAG